ncbi:MAG: hypothetical protein ABIG28_03465 [archaeon]
MNEKPLVIRRKEDFDLAQTGGRVSIDGEVFIYFGPANIEEGSLRRPILLRAGKRGAVQRGAVYYDRKKAHIHSVLPCPPGSRYNEMFQQLGENK